MIGRGVSVAVAFIDEEEQTAGQAFIAGNHETTLAARQVLALLQTEATDRAHSAGGASVPGSKKRLGGIFDHRQSARAGKLEDRTHLARVAKKMRDHDGAGARSKHGFDGLRG